MPGRSKTNIPPAPDRRKDAAKRPSLEVDGFSDDYLSVVAHDLRGSLNSIIGWAELIKRQALNEAGNVRAGETIIRQAKQQLELVNEVVDTWRLLSGNLRLQLTPVDAKELVNTAAYAAKEATPGKGDRVRFPARSASRSAARGRRASPTGTGRSVQQRHPFRPRQGHRRSVSCGRRTTAWPS